MNIAARIELASGGAGLEPSYGEIGHRREPSGADRQETSLRAHHVQIVGEATLEPQRRQVRFFFGEADCGVCLFKGLCQTVLVSVRVAHLLSRAQP